VGIVNEDQNWIWLRDAVYFPQGTPGTCDRLLWRSELKENSPGVAVLPVLPSGKIILILTYRHATRSWELELPRGGMESKETFEEAAFRELKEETGFVASAVSFLGEIATDTGVHSSVIPVFMGKISAQDESAPEYFEAIAGTLAFTKDEIKEGLVKGFLEVTIHGVKKQIPLRDAFLTFAILHAECRKLL
jgi:ADP-ribose pyrophosphatase